MVTNEGYNMQFIQITKTRSQPAKLKNVPFMEKIECKKYPKEVWNSQSREQQMYSKNLQEQQDQAHLQAAKH